MQRRLCSAILFLEAVVLGLSTPVMISVESVDKSQALWIGLGLTVACLLVAGMLRKPWAYGVGWAIQIAAVALGVLVTAMYVLGAIFLLLWLAAVRIGRLIDTDRAAAEAAATEAH
ncbi:DUF4233 domain-containing protein [Nocardioides marmorisolisilvae]|uniref:DUF4233 domain-containing protein n=1 Tax=Nocardioides marmorisolisilvae TaxID=1542737 RepID=A0A3N0DT47_9ACTN|nr:DUF4233 domain-containing protein [Nocardioides marmorisolisilvae]RNL78799.1 DUF4233 domain-containing protein [Nocardioides marmorisolisilvae]